MASYKLVTYAGVEGPRAGVAIDEQIFDAAKLTGHAADANRARHHGGLAGGERTACQGCRFA